MHLNIAQSRLATIAWALGLSLAQQLQAGEIQSLASIRLQSEAFIAGYPYESPYPARFQIESLDTRLRLKACPQALAIEFAQRNKTHGNTALRVKCPLKPGWKIHLPIRVDLFDDVLVAAKPLVKGQIIDESAVVLQKQNISRLNYGYYAKQAALGQLQVRRNLTRGTVLTPSNLVPRLLVRSGQQVTLLLAYKGIEIKSSGLALRSASLGERVKVRNSQSGKVVEGVVSGESQVRISI